MITMAPSRLNFLLINIVFFLTLVSSSPNGGFRARLIPPTSPDSPFYNQILEANNISSIASTNITLNRTHYHKWKKTLTNIQKPSMFRDYNDSKWSRLHFEEAVHDRVVDLSIGTPFQSLYGYFDTGSDLIWFPCNNEGQPATKGLPKFRPSDSVSSLPIYCSQGDKCLTRNSAIHCGLRWFDRCNFDILYEDTTSASGDMYTDVVSTSSGGEQIPGFMFGCGTRSPPNFPGVIGAGLGAYSLPNQLNPTDPKFSYCISYELDTNYVSFGVWADLLGKNTTFLRNKNNDYFYLDVVGIKLNDRVLPVPTYEYDMSFSGNRGFIIDSGAALGYLAPKIFDALADELKQLLGVPIRHKPHELCYPRSRFTKRGVKLWPTITIQFYEFDLVLPSEGTWVNVGTSDKLHCLMVQMSQTPISTLGYMQLYDVNVGYDPRNNKLYFQPDHCGKQA